MKHRSGDMETVSGWILDELEVKALVERHEFLCCRSMYLIEYVDSNFPFVSVSRFTLRDGTRRHTSRVKRLEQAGQEKGRRVALGATVVVEETSMVGVMVSTRLISRLRCVQALDQEMPTIRIRIPFRT